MVVSSIEKVKRTERGWAGHFFGADRCKFRRNTLLEYKDKKWIVSTVGCYVNSGIREDAIGYNRWYETMAFEAVKLGLYWDADVSKPISFESDWGIWGETFKDVMRQYPNGVDNAANDMHEAVVKELMGKITEE